LIFSRDSGFGFLSEYIVISDEDALGGSEMSEWSLAANLKVRLWFENSRDEAFFGEGIANLLEAIERQKSISVACKDIGMSYRYALHRISIAEKRSGMPLVRRFRGGAPKGGAELTDQGRFLLEKYFEAKRLVEEFAKSMQQVP
jgi:molybdate transport system regulatory protein